MKRALSLLGILVLLCSCARAKRGDMAALPDQPPPADLLGYGTLPPRAIDELRAFATAIGKPLPIDRQQIADGLGQLVGASGLKNLDASAPMHLVVLDPKQYDRPLVAVVKMTGPVLVDGAFAKSEGGWSVIGAKPVVEAVSGWCLSTLVRAPAAMRPIFTVKSQRLLASYRKDIESLGPMMAMAAPSAQAPGGNSAATGELMGKLGRLYADGIIALLDASEELQLAIELDGKGAALDFAVVPRKGGDLAKFIAVQKPIDPALVKRLPSAGPGPQPMLFVGHLESGPYRERLVNAVFDAAGGIVAGLKLDPALRAKTLAVMDMMTGDMAAWMRPAVPMVMAEYVGVTDGAKVMAAMREAMQVFVPPSGVATYEVMGMKTTYKFTASGAPIEGVPPMEWTTSVDVSGMSALGLPAEQREALAKLYATPVHGVMLAADRWMVATMGLPPEGTAAAVRAARDGAGFVLSPAAQAAVDEAAARGQSFVMFMSIVDALASNPAFGPMLAHAKAESGMALSLGFADGSAHLRLALPMAHLQEIMGQLGGLGAAPGAAPGAR